MRKPTFPRRRVMAAVGSAAAIVVASGFALTAPAASADATSAQQQTSQNWSGYVVQSSAGKSFSNVSGSWVEPSVSSSSAQGYAAFWVGLGGASQQSQALEQTGTSAQVVNGQVTYYAWYELVPSAQVTLPLAIHPGDHMSGRVTVNGSNVTISLDDQTTGQSVTKTLQMSNPDTSSAEWIAEAPASEAADGSMQILPLADFGNVTFTNASATAGGQTGSISDPAWTVEQVDLSNAGGAPFLGDGSQFSPAGLGAGDAQQSAAGATAGGVSSDGTSFTVSYTSDATATPSGTSPGSSGGTSASGDPGSGYSGDGSGYPGGSAGYPGGGYPGGGYPGGGYDYSGGYGYSGGGYSYSGGYVLVFPGGYSVYVQ
jgi:hypothetical protein